ncbi:hypothetical protein MKZ38_009485 [Zalerion maritima]|uniref:Uncharacterized protein n=1 Tax=Zalerion maritima TaxID=339359 RepID=A0AAD5RGG2_9PEZI|nr:hypothetical protein MKZ38_009485 [Zalerion maritima]
MSPFIVPTSSIPGPLYTCISSSSSTETEQFSDGHTSSYSTTDIYSDSDVCFPLCQEQVLAGVGSRFVLRDPREYPTPETSLAPPEKLFRELARASSLPRNLPSKNLKDWADDLVDSFACLSLAVASPFEYLNCESQGQRFLLGEADSRILTGESNPGTAAGQVASRRSGRNQTSEWTPDHRSSKQPAGASLPTDASSPIHNTREEARCIFALSPSSDYERCRKTSFKHLSEYLKHAQLERGGHVVNPTGISCIADCSPRCETHRPDGWYWCTKCYPDPAADNMSSVEWEFRDWDAFNAHYEGCKQNRNLTEDTKMNRAHVVIQALDEKRRARGEVCPDFLTCDKCKNTSTSPLRKRGGTDSDFANGFKKQKMRISPESQPTRDEEAEELKEELERKANELGTVYIQCQALEAENGSWRMENEWLKVENGTMKMEIERLKVELEHKKRENDKLIGRCEGTQEMFFAMIRSRGPGRVTRRESENHTHSRENVDVDMRSCTEGCITPDDS